MPTIDLLADHPDLVHEVGWLRWREWGLGDPKPDEWIAVTRREAGRDRLPITLVAIDDEGRAAGAVGLDEEDDALTGDERDSRSPWLVGMVVRGDRRGQGVGLALVRALEILAESRGHDRVWVVTGAPAVGFYRACGWVAVQELVTAKEGLSSTALASALRR